MKKSFPMLAENVEENVLDVRPFMIDLIPQTSYVFSAVARNRLMKPIKEARRRACGKGIAKLFSFSSKRMVHAPRNIGDFHSIIEAAESIRPVFGLFVPICQKQISILLKQGRGLTQIVKRKTILVFGNNGDILRIKPAEMKKIARLAVNSYMII